MIGRSPAMQELFESIRRLAPQPHRPRHRRNRNRQGAVATALHARGRRSATFLTVNCAAVVETLFESELFGHVRGAFTGATDDKVGPVRSRRDGGTLFLDEIGELPLALQAKLLRALEHGEVQRVGSLESQARRRRVIAATNRDLRGEVGRAAVSERSLLPPQRRRTRAAAAARAARGHPVSRPPRSSAMSARLGRPITGLTPARRADAAASSGPATSASCAT